LLKRVTILESEDYEYMQRRKFTNQQSENTIPPGMQCRRWSLQPYVGNM
jgi:hypothetical protein